MQIDPPSSPTVTIQASFLEKLVANTQLSPNLSNPNLLLTKVDLTDETNPSIDSDNFIPLTAKDKSRLYSPWQFSVIVKVVGLKVGHQILRQKIYNLWKPTEELPLVDLGSDFFLLKFQ